jgi:hypothetical protein
MKTTILICSIVACALSAPIVSAQEKPAKPAMKMHMDKPMSGMQENMKKMQQQMDKIGATTDPKERQKLMQEHMQTMQANMKAMKGMGKQKADGMTGGDMKPRQEMMEQRMDMMQQMMEQMMQRDQAMNSMPHM